MTIEETVLYEDESVLICYKEAGMPVQSKNIRNKDLESWVRAYLSKKMKKGNPYLAVINRLDQPVEGLVVFAREKKAAAALSVQLTNGEMEKYYLTVTQGIWEEKEGTLTDYLLKDSRTNTSRVVGESGNGKKSMLKYQVIETNRKEQLICIHLLTGRHHQIRVQLSHAGHAIQGDAKYQSSAPKAEQDLHKFLANGEEQAVYPALCAFRLKFCHPVTGKKIQIQIKPRGTKFKAFTYCENLLETIG